MEFAPRSRIGSFEVTSLLGTGGMGAVYKARDLDLARDVAIKVLREDLFDDPTVLERFKREARAASALNHPNIVTIHEIGVHDGTHFLVMEYVRGATLRTLMKVGQLELDEALRLGTQIAEGLAKAHDAGIIHRDLKPENLMVTEDGLVKILDFGLAKLAEVSEASADTPTVEQHITQQGVILGTVAYMSPEQLSDSDIDQRSDQFSLGTILYEMIAGTRPFERPSVVQAIVSIMEFEPDPLRLHRSVPEELATLVTRLLEKSASERYESARDIADALRAIHSRTVSSVDALSGAAHPQQAGFPKFLDTPSDDEDARSAPLFVGRTSERERLNEILNKAMKGAGQLVFVTGEPGSGKTSLLQEFIRRAQDEHDNLVVAVGHCNARTGTSDPYLPFRELLHLLTGDVEARTEAGAMSRDQALRLWRLLPDALSTLLKGGPDLIDRLVDSAGVLERGRQYGCNPEDLAQLRQLAERRESQDSGTGVQQSVLLEQGTKVFQGLSRRCPLMIVLEDIHWADDGTISLLCHLCKHVERYPIFLVGSYRSEDLPSGAGGKPHPLTTARNELRRKYGDFEIRMGEAGAREFVDALLDVTPNHLGEEFREALVRQTQGHPLFTVELLRDLTERGVITEDEGKRSVVSADLDWDTLPVRVEAVIAERIGRLPKKLQGVLRVGSVEGEDLTAEVAARIEGIDEREIIRLLSDEADKRHQLVRALDVRRSGSQRLSVYRFRHILFQKYLHHSLDRIERSYLHEQIGNTLESLLGAKADDAAVQLAHHFQQAGLAHKAFHYLALSGDKARQAYATQEAIAFYTQSIEASGEMAPERNDARLLAVYEGRGLVSMSLTRFDEAIADFHEMRRLAKASNDARMEAESLSHLAYCHFVKMGDDQIPFMEQYALEARALSEQTGDQNILSKSLAILGVVHETRGNLVESSRILEQSMEICRREGYKDALVQNLFHLGQQAYWSADFSAAVEIGEEGLAVSSEIRDGFQELVNLAVVALAYWGAGRYQKAFGVVQDGLRRTDELQNKFIEGRLLNTLGWFHRDLGDFYGAVELHERGLEQARSTGVLNVEISALIDLGHDYLGLGQIERALTQLEPTLERVENGQHVAIALEIFYGGKTGHELAKRAARLLGAEATEQIRTYDQARRFYRVRSSLVHTEEPAPARDSLYGELEAGWDLACRSLGSLLKRDIPVDWAQVRPHLDQEAEDYVKQFV